ncbi:MAG: hypothetical protein M3R38_07160 [Actinomycetota bacterium]|nr:hypothetical protein [Actinomycetota bacterium]
MVFVSRIYRSSLLRLTGSRLTKNEEARLREYRATYELGEVENAHARASKPEGSIFTPHLSPNASLARAGAYCLLRNVGYSDREAFEHMDAWGCARG